MVTKFLDHNNRELEQRGRWQQSEQEKKQQVYIFSKTTTAFFLTLVHFLAIVHECDIKLSNLTRLLYGVCEHSTKIFYFFFQTYMYSCIYDPFRFNCRKFCENFTNFTKLDTAFMQELPMQITFTIGDKLKTTWPGKHLAPIQLLAYPADESICIVSHLKQYIECSTKPLPLP